MIGFNIAVWVEYMYFNHNFTIEEADVTSVLEIIVFQNWCIL